MSFRPHCNWFSVFTSQLRHLNTPTVLYSGRTWVCFLCSVFVSCFFVSPLSRVGSIGNWMLMYCLLFHEGRMLAGFWAWDLVAKRHTLFSSQGTGRNPRGFCAGRIASRQSWAWCWCLRSCCHEVLMRRGTTPRLKFLFPFNLLSCASQSSNIVFYYSKSTFHFLLIAVGFLYFRRFLGLPCHIGVKGFYQYAE